MEIPQHIKEEAERILAQESKTLPTQLDSAPEFFIANADDTTIQAFGAISHEGIEYKIGTQKA